jgi:hypothetical protein
MPYILYNSNDINFQQEGMYGEMEASIQDIFWTGPHGKA